MIEHRGNIMLNDLKVDPNEWFDNPLDKMPIATDGGGNNRYHPDKEVADWYDNAPSEYEPPMQESDWFIEKPKVEASNTPEGGGSRRKDQLEDVTIHEKMYQIATSKYNPFAVGGSESIHDFGGGSETIQK